MGAKRETDVGGPDSREVCLIFNPLSGSGRRPPVRPENVLGQLRREGFSPELHLVRPGFDLRRAVRRALAKGVRLFAVCGGDGTVSPAARELAGRGATLGILPAGTQNNIACSLRVPASIPEAVRLLDKGRRVRADMGAAVCGGRELPFLEVCTVGLFSAIFPAADDFQHGRISRIGDLLATLITSPPASVCLTLADGAQLRVPAHMLLVSNMPRVIRRYRVGTPACYRDGMLDVLLFDGLSKLEMAGVALRGGVRTLSSDRRLQKLRVRSLDVQTDPPMPVMADGEMLGVTPLHLEICPRVLTLIAGPVRPETGRPGTDRPSAGGKEGDDDEG